jgi:hypothetical protein
MALLTIVLKSKTQTQQICTLSANHITWILCGEVEIQYRRVRDRWQGVLTSGDGRRDPKKRAPYD